MEHLKQQPSEDKPHAHREEASGHTEVFERDGEIYEEVSFLYEPMEQYKDDLMVLNIVIDAKKRALQEAEEKLTMHGTVAGSPMQLLEGDIASKIAYKRKELGRLEVVRAATLHRLSIVAKQDHLEKNILDNLPTDVEQ